MSGGVLGDLPTWVLALSEWSCPGSGFCRTPGEQGGAQILGRLSWTSCWAMSWLYSETLWSFPTLTARSHRGRWTSLERETCHVSVLVTYSVPPVVTRVQNTRRTDQTSQTAQTLLFKNKLVAVYTKAKKKNNNKPGNKLKGGCVLELANRCTIRGFGRCRAGHSSPCEVCEWVLHKRRRLRRPLLILKQQTKQPDVFTDRLPLAWSNFRA